ncbi:MAG: polyprenyl synthetase family protein [Aggregatilineales bacterium]
MVFSQLLQRYAVDLDQTMRQVVSQLAPDSPTFQVMVSYPLGWSDEHGHPYTGQVGKRLRPLFLLLCTEAAGGDWRQALPAAAAVELLHNFSLVHDDIQDASPLRHGRATVWRVWGTAHAINTGDALFSLAFVALEQLSQRGLEPNTLIRVWRVFNHTNLELTRGQHLDMLYEKLDRISVDEYLSMVLGKSAALLGACAQIGALIATGDELLAQIYGEFAINLGLAFQIRDDILGIWGNPAVTGKSAATDISSRKKSLPVLCGLSRSSQLAHIYSFERLSQADIEQAVSLLDSAGARDYALQVEAEYYSRAVAALERAQPQGEAADWLKQFLAGLLQRSY